MKTITTKKIYSFIIIMVFSFAFVNAQSPRNLQTINPIIGDISYVAKFGEQPDATTNEDLRIQTHLAYVENLLRQKDVSNLSPQLQAKREHNLDLLHDYWTRGKFPRNYDYKETRKPCFIDKDNTICAVGYLVEQTAGRQAAEAINNKYKYEEVLAMNDNLVDRWIVSSGLSKVECAMIQPSYCWFCCLQCSANKVCAMRYNNCVWENKCLNPSQVAQWQAHAHPCDSTSGNSGNGRLTNSTAGSGEYSLNIYPNPVSGSTTIYFSLDETQKVSLNIFDVSGRLIATLVDAFFEEGDHEIEWNAADVNSGIYFLRMETASYSENQKLIVAK